MKVNLYKDETSCCGCSACASICPKNAIIMQADKKGFLIPNIDDELCVNCGLCIKTCPMQNPIKENYKPQVAVYAGIHKKDSIRQKSRSGGIFMSVAEWIIAQGGSVYGAAFAKDLSVKHRKANSFEQCSEFQGSKYVQSDLQKTFFEAANDLKQGRYVLYSGTGCQIDGLLHYLSIKKVDMGRLLTCDLVCHGNVSPKMYEDYRKWYENKYHGKITNFDFRDKSNGWTTHLESFVINGIKHTKKGYTELYYCKAAYRASCYVCPYADIKRVGDFSLADCWGASEKLPDMYDNKGISLLLVNTYKVNLVIRKVFDSLNIREVDLKNFMQPQLCHPIEMSEHYSEFWNMYQKKGFAGILKKFGKQNVKDNAKRWIKWNIFKNFN